MQPPKAIYQLFLFEDNLFQNEEEIFRNKLSAGMEQNICVTFATHFLSYTPLADTYSLAAT